MGLDMYLKASKFFINNDNELKDKLKKLIKINLEPIKITFNVMCWRKSNAIHKWFVNNVQSGVDDCKDYNVTIDDLK
ncbi:MAG: hypothetical protein K0A90_00290, partial [Methanosarcinaceae archaeon]|nr:hypothetical protein [Methanosarcinaceae archaeon]